MEPTGPHEPQTIRCQTVLPDGQPCGTGLWRALNDDLLEVSHGLRSGRRFTVVLPLSAAQQTLIPCVRCQTRWFASTAHEPRALSRQEAAFVITARRPSHEVVALVEHNASQHDGEAA